MHWSIALTEVLHVWIIFIVAAGELHKMLNEEELREADLLVFANKQDMPDAMGAAEVSDKLNLHSLTSRQWYTQACCATSGDGLYEGVDWLAQRIREKQTSQ